MPDFDEALSQIAEIRSQIATSTRFKGFAAAPFVAAAVICALIALVQDFAAQPGRSDSVSFVAFWGIVLAGVTLMVAVEGYSRAIREHGQLADLMLGTTIRRLAPFGLTMAMTAYVICSEVPESAWMIPGIWLILMGLAGFATAASLSDDNSPCSILPALPGMAEESPWTPEREDLRECSLKSQDEPPLSATLGNTAPSCQLQRLPRPRRDPSPPIGHRYLKPAIPGYPSPSDFWEGDRLPREPDANEPHRYRPKGKMGQPALC